MATHIAAEANDPRARGMFLFASERDVAIRHPETILSHIWYTPADDASHTLLE